MLSVDRVGRATELVIIIYNCSRGSCFYVHFLKMATIVKQQSAKIRNENHSSVAVLGGLWWGVSQMLQPALQKCKVLCIWS